MHQRIVILGAGASGRGHIGHLAHDAGFAVTYIERRADLVETLRRAGRFTVVEVGEPPREVVIDGFEVLHPDEKGACLDAIAEADIVCTCVLPTNLRAAAPLLAAGLARRRERRIPKPLNVIACENMERSTTTFYRHIRESAPDLDWAWIDANAGFPDSMIARAIPVPKDPLRLISEPTQEWSVDATAVREPMPRIAGMTLSTNQAAMLERKLYIKNCGHMAIGVYGFLKGYALMDAAHRDPEIHPRIDALTRESAAAVVRKHGLDPAETERYRLGFMEIMKSPLLPDDVKRVIREPLRKLAREERLVGPAMLACEQGETPKALAHAIAAALTVVTDDDPRTLELQRRLEKGGLEQVLEDVCGITRGHALAGLVRDEWRRIGEKREGRSPS